MVTFYSLPTWMSLALSMVSGACVIAQSIALAYSLMRSHTKRPRRWLEDALQTAVLLEAFLFAYCMSVVRMGMLSCYVYLPQHAALRYAAFVLVGLLAAVASLSLRRIYPLFTIAAAAFTLPAVEGRLGGVFSWGYIAALLFFLARAVHMILLNRREFETELSAFSIMSAVDALHSGVLFSEPGGYILLCNRRMRNLMLALTGKIHRNADVFFYCVSENQTIAGCEKLDTPDSFVYRLPDGGVWLFTRCEIADKACRYVQISAADITKVWQATERLRLQNAELSLRSEELKAMLADIGSRVREAEVLRMQSALHDLLGQRLALLLRALREGSEPDDGVLAVLADGLMVETEARHGAVRSRIKTLIKLMGDIGVSLVVKGGYPNEPSAQEVCADAITEAVTNSVRHGFASEVTVDMYKSREGFIMGISDNGVYRAGGGFTEGSGLKTLRRKLAEIGGRLDILTEPAFRLNITIPNGRNTDD